MSVRIVFYARTSTIDLPDNMIEDYAYELSDKLAILIDQEPVTDILTVGLNYYHDDNPECDGCTEVQHVNEVKS